MRTQNPVLGAILLLVVANQFGILSDALIKHINFQGPLVQLLLYRQLTAALILLPFWLKFGRQSHGCITIHALRANIWVVTTFSLFFALNYLPLATTHALYYSLPLIMLPLAWLMYGDRITPLQKSAALAGFIGVLVIIRPTEINWGALAAITSAVTMALNSLLVRKLPAEESVVSALFWMNVLGMPVTAIATLTSNAVFDPELLLWAGLSSILVLGYHGGLITAYRLAKAGSICGAEYTGLVGSILLGFAVFGEIPDALTLVGAMMIILPLLYIGMKQDKEAVVSP